MLGPTSHDVRLGLNDSWRVVLFRAHGVVPVRVTVLIASLAIDDNVNHIALLVPYDPAKRLLGLALDGSHRSSRCGIGRVGKGIVAIAQMRRQERQRSAMRLG